MCNECEEVCDGCYLERKPMLLCATTAERVGCRLEIEGVVTKLLVLNKRGICVGLLSAH